MTTDIPISAVTGGTGATKPAAGPKNELDKQAFLELFVAQLKYQDPSSPMDTSQMMAQTTQLSTMESLEEMATTSRESFALQMRMSASELVGKQVSWVDAEGATQHGTVSGVSYKAAVPVVMVGDTQVDLNSVSLVTTPGGPTDVPKAPAASGSGSSGSGSSGSGSSGSGSSGSGSGSSGSSGTGSTGSSTTTA